MKRDDKRRAASSGKTADRAPPTRAILAEQSKPILDLIRHARELDRKGKGASGRYALIQARKKLAETLGEVISHRDAEHEVEKGRVRLRRAADKTETQLRRLISASRLWGWTDPEHAIREQRLGHFGGLDHLPLTDIEDALKKKGNVLLIIAVYSALRGPDPRAPDGGC